MRELQQGLRAGLALGMMLLAAAVAGAGTEVGGQVELETLRSVEPAPEPEVGPGLGAPVEAGAPPKLELESVRVEPPGGDAELLVRRNLPLRTGEMIDSETLVQVREHLLATRLFSEIDLYTMRGSRPGAVTAVVAARPSRRFHLETGLGHDPLQRWYLNIVSLRRTGLFDRGATARVSFRTGFRTSGLWGELEVPGLTARDTDLLVNVAGFDEIWHIQQGDSARYQTIGRSQIQAGLRRHLRDDLSAVGWLGYGAAHPSETLHANDESPEIPAAPLVPSIRDLHFGELRGELVRDRQDWRRPWQNGSLVALVLHATVPDRGTSFWGGELDARVAVPVALTRAAAFRFRAGYTSAETPYFFRPIVGGVGSLRGFPAGGLSGPRGARAFGQLSAEWRHPLIGSDPRRPRVTGTLFADCGDHWTASGRRADFSAGVGYGALFRVRWVQTLNLEVAYPLANRVEGNPVAVYLSLGPSF